MENGLAMLRIAYADKRLVEAVEVYQQLVDQGAATPEAHFYGGISLRGSGELYGARLALERGLQEAPAGTLRMQITLTYGVVLREIGEIRAAVEQLEQFVQEVAQDPELSRLSSGAGWYNLALAYRQARRLADSVAAYNRACAECRREGVESLLMKALQNLAWVYCMLGDEVNATAALDEAEELCAEPEAIWHQQLGRAHAAFVVEDYETMGHICARLASDPRPLPDSVRSHAYWLLGRAALAERRHQDAEAAAYLAMHFALADQSRDSRCMQDVSELNREINSVRGGRGA